MPSLILVAQVSDVCAALAWACGCEDRGAGLGRSSVRKDNLKSLENTNRLDPACESRYEHLKLGMERVHWNWLKSKDQDSNHIQTRHVSNQQCCNLFSLVTCLPLTHCSCTSILVAHSMVTSERLIWQQKPKMSTRFVIVHVLLRSVGTAGSEK